MRLGARLIDCILVSIGAAVATALAWASPPKFLTQAHRDSLMQVLTFQFAWIAVAFLNDFVLIAANGCTLGKRFAGILVVDHRRGRRPHWAASLVRSLVPTVIFAGTAVVSYGVVLFAPIGAALAWITTSLALATLGLDDCNQGPHDRCADTLVIVRR